MRTSLGRTALAIAGTAAVLMGNAAPVDAVVRTTTYYTINLWRPAGSPRQLLGVQKALSGDPVRVKAVGDALLASTEWARVVPEWPGFPPVSGHGPLDGITDCSANPATIGCPFRGHANLDEDKFVNRASGKCLTLADGPRGTIAVQATCAATGHLAVEQVWGHIGTLTTASSFEQVKRAIVAGRTETESRCLSPVPPNDHRLNAPVGGVSCSPVPALFYLRPVSRATCDIGVTNDICGPRRGSAAH